MTSLVSFASYSATPQCFRMKESSLGRPVKSCKLVAVEPATSLWVRPAVVRPPAWALTLCSSLLRPLDPQAASMVASAAKISQRWATITRTNSVRHTILTRRASQHPLRRRSRLLTTSLQRLLSLLPLPPRRNLRSQRRRMTLMIQNQTMMTTIQMMRIPTMMTTLTTARTNAKKLSAPSVAKRRASLNLLARKLPLWSRSQPKRLLLPFKMQRQ